MPDDKKIVVVGLLTEPEFKRWGRKLRHVYMPDGNAEFDDLLRAIDEAEARLSSGKSPPNPNA
jgi:hypothetical protein